ncbi:MAG: zinc ribbon domain-containing protein [Defluviitaleaceae bacterium]|nr:zinc ribbon domain-containing protein [Defluviitaleaceae bacterium]
MRPWNKRGFLHWLFFQDPGKRVANKPRKQTRQKPPPKPLEEAAYADESITAENWHEPVVAYPMPNGEEVLEAKLIDFVENDYGDADELTGQAHEEEMPGPYGPEITIPLNEDISAVPDSATDETETPQESDASKLMMLLDEPNSALFMNVPEQPDIPQTLETPDVQQQDSENLSAVPQAETDKVGKHIQDESDVQNRIPEHITPEDDNVAGAVFSPENNDDTLAESTNVELPDVSGWETDVQTLHDPISTEVSVSAQESDNESVLEYVQEPDNEPEYAQKPNDESVLKYTQESNHEPASEHTQESNNEPASEHTHEPNNELAPEYTHESNNDLAPEYIPNTAIEALPAYIREANEELPLMPPGAEAPCEPGSQTYHHAPQSHPHAIQTCDQCGTISNKTDNYCGRCGANLLKPQIPPVTAYCGSCGAKNEHKLKFCGDCGYKLVTERH